MTVKDGSELIVRPIRSTDEEMLSDMFYNPSDDTIINRFISMPKSMPQRRLQQFCCIDYEMEMPLVAVTKEGVEQKVVGLGGYHSNPATHGAEIAFMVADAWQGKGIGTFMMESIVRIARTKNIKGLTAEVLRDSAAMIALMHKGGIEPKSMIADSSNVFTMDLQGGRISETG